MIVAVFESERDLCSTLERLREAEVAPLETYTPAPLEGADESSPIPLVILVAGLLGGAASFALQTWSSTISYPFRIGGRPAFAWPSFIPTVFENAVLVAVLGGFAAFLAVTRLPRWYEPVDEARGIRSASSDGWVVSIGGEAPAMLERAAAVLRSSPAIHVERVPS